MKIYVLPYDIHRINRDATVVLISTPHLGHVIYIIANFCVPTYTTYAIMQKYLTSEWVALAKIRVRIKFGSDNPNNIKIRTKNWSPIPGFFESDNTNVKNLMSGFKIRTKNSCPYPVFSGSNEFEYSGRTNFCQHYEWATNEIRSILAT